MINISLITFDNIIWFMTINSGFKDAYLSPIESDDNSCDNDILKLHT